MLSRTKLIYSISNARNKRLDIELSGTALLARRIGAFETTLCFP